MLLLTVLAATACAVFGGALPVLDRSPKDSVLTTRQTGSLPTSFKWSSSGALVGPKSDGRNIAGIKDPSIVEVGGTYHVFASTAQDKFCHIPLPEDDNLRDIMGGGGGPIDPASGNTGDLNNGFKMRPFHPKEGGHTGIKAAVIQALKNDKVEGVKP